MLFSKNDLNKHVEQVSLSTVLDVISQRFFDIIKNDPIPRTTISLRINKKTDLALFNAVLIHRESIGAKFKDLGWIGVMFKVTVSYIDITLV